MKKFLKNANKRQLKIIGAAFGLYCSFATIFAAAMNVVIENKMKIDSGNSSLLSAFGFNIWWIQEMGSFFLISTILILMNIKNIKAFFHPLLFGENRKYLYAHIFFGSFGGLFFALTLVFVGGNYANIFSGFYPLFGAIFARFFIKELLNKWGYSALGVGIGLILLFCVLTIIFQKSPSPSEEWHIYVGIGFGIATSVFWAFESVMCESYLSRTPTPAQNLIVYRGIFASVISTVAFFTFIATTTPSVNSTLSHFYATNNVWYLWIIGVSIFVSMRFAWVLSVKYAGSIISSIIDSSYVTTSPIIFTLLKFVDPESFSHDEVAQWWAFPIVIGLFACIVFIVLKGTQHKPKEEKKTKKTIRKNKHIK